MHVCSGPVHPHCLCGQCFSMCLTWAVLCAVLDDMVAAIGPLEVEQLHAESAPGQFEIVTTHKEALEVLPKTCFCPCIHPHT